MIKQLIILLLLLFLSFSAIIKNMVPVGTIQAGNKNEEKDLAFAFTKDSANKILIKHCNIELGEVISLQKQVTVGWQYNIDFNTSFGPINVIAWTKYWEKNVSILNISFNFMRNEVNESINLPTFVKNAIAKLQNQKKSTQSGNNTGIDKFEFPQLKRICDLINDQKPVKKTSYSVSQTYPSSKFQTSEDKNNGMAIQSSSTITKQSISSTTTDSALNEVALDSQSSSLKKVIISGSDINSASTTQSSNLKNDTTS